MDSADTGAAITTEKTDRAKPTSYLPTDRISFPKQLDLLRAYGAINAQSGSSVSLKEAGDMTKLAPTTATLANAFFMQNGFLQKQEGGKFLPASEVVAFARAFTWNQDTAARKLEPLVRASWFGKALVPRLQFRAQSEDEAITALAEACNAGPEYRAQLRMLLDYLKASGVVENEGGQLTLASSTSPTQTDQIQPPRETSVQPAPRSAGTISTAFSQQATEGVVQFHVSVRVDMAELAGWKPDRIASFFAGIAQVLAAKGAIEKGVSED
jgi:hypothetical protein